MKQPAASMDRPVNAFRSAVALLDKCLDAAALLARCHDQRHGCCSTADHVASLAIALFRRATQDRYQPSREDIVKTLASLGSLPDPRKPTNGTADRAPGARQCIGSEGEARIEGCAARHGVPVQRVLEVARERFQTVQLIALSKGQESELIAWIEQQAPPQNP